MTLRHIGLLMKKKNSKKSEIKKRKAARRHSQEAEYGRDEFLFGAEEDDYSDYNDDDEYDGEDVDYDEDFESEEYEDEKYPSDEYSEEYDGEDINFEDALPEFEPEDPDFFTRDLDAETIEKTVASTPGFYVAPALNDDEDFENQNNVDEDDEDFEDAEYEDEYYEDEYSDEEEFFEDEDYYEDEEDYENEDDVDFYEDEDYDPEFEAEIAGYSPSLQESLRKARAKKNGKNKRDIRKMSKKAAKNKSAAKKASKKADAKLADAKKKTKKANELAKKSKKNSRKAKNNSRDEKRGFFGTIILFFTNMSMGDRLIVATGVCVLVVAIVASSLYFNNRILQSQIDEFASIGSELDDVYVIGERGLNATASAKATFVPIEEEPEVQELFIEEEEEIPEPEIITIVMNLSTIQSDLKIKFNSKDTGKLVTGIPFSVKVEGDNGYSKTWTDENKDGVIYHTDMENGTYTVTMEALDKDKYPDYISTTEVMKQKVTDEIAYKKVDVSDEIKKESEVNAAVEDTAVQDTAVESVLQDTVEWVESTKTLISGSEDGYQEINKSDIVSPSATSKRIKSEELIATSYTYSIPYVAAELTITISGANEVEVGKSTGLSSTVENSASDSTVTWSTSDASIATVDASGNVTGVAAGTVTITATSNEDGSKTQTYTITVKAPENAGGAGDAGGGAGNGNGAGGAAGGDAGGNNPGGAPKQEALKVGISPTNVSRTAGAANETIVASATGGDGNYTYYWASSDPNVVNVSGTGTTASLGFGKAGTATITLAVVCMVDGVAVTEYKTCTVTVAENTQIQNTAKLVTNGGKQVYIKNAAGQFVEATAADYGSDRFYVISNENAVYKYTGWQTIDGNTYFFDKNGNFVTGEQVIQGAKYNFDSNGRLSSSAGAMGIDVSKWNGSIDWNAVKNSGVSYVIIRCGYRGSTTGALIEDPMFRTNISGAKAAGLKVGAYFFTQAVSEAEAVEEASMAISLCSKYGLNLPLFLDVESSKGRGDAIDSGTRTAVVRAFCQTVQNSGITSGVYANKVWLTSYMNASALTGYKIWLAQYAAAPTYSATRFDYWQYSSKGSIPGISGNVDLNLKY